ncbi:MAG: hypothetical protein WAO35_26305 [Terriglobia bacterium]
MQTKATMVRLIVAVLATFLMTPQAYAAAASPEVESLVRGFPTLDELETHLGLEGSREGADPPQSARANMRSEGTQGYILPVSSRWFTAPLATDPLSASALASKTEPEEKPLASLLADMDAAQKEAGTLGKQISTQNNLPINRYLLDRFTLTASTSYGTNITGLFVNGIGFGQLQQTLLQNYGVTYSLPLLQRYSKSSKWTRVLNGWTVSSNVGAMPQLGQSSHLLELLNNLQLTWSVALSYNLSGSTLRKIQDGQYTQQAAADKAADRITATREELLKKMALRIDALSANRPARDTRTTSLRELYPQFELYQARFEQATSCDEQMEDFFTLKGLALSLLTLAGYDYPDNSGSDLLPTWKRARFTGCGRT